jgi:hypothetical protein
MTASNEQQQQCSSNGALHSSQQRITLSGNLSMNVASFPVLPIEHAGVSTQASRENAYDEFSLRDLIKEALDIIGDDDLDFSASQFEPSDMNLERFLLDNRSKQCDE